MQAPRATKRTHFLENHGTVRHDEWYWLGERSAEVLAHLEAENAYHAQEMAPLKELEETLFAEIKSRIEETDISVPTRKGDWWYIERTTEGLNYPVHSRVPAHSEEPPAIAADTVLPGEQIILDENLEAGDAEYFSVGILSVSPDASWVAVGKDVTGAERHRVTFRPLAGQEPVSDLLEDVYYGFSWAKNSRYVFYTRVDEAMRPWQLWRHELGTDATHDVLVFEEPDAQYTVGVSRTRNDEMIIIHLGSSMTTESWWIPADDPTREPQVFEARRHGIEYGLDHWRDHDGRGWWLKVTNEGATDFRLLATPVDALDWREVIPERPGTRLDGVDPFEGLFVVSERLDGSAAVRVVPVATAAALDGDVLATSWLIPTAVSPATVGLGANPDVTLRRLRVGITSLVTPRLVADVDVTTREVHVLKQQIVRGGYRAEDYVTGRWWVDASDGVKIPVSFVARRDLVTAEGQPTAPHPTLLYGYGSYEVSIDPSFSSLRLSLLDRGIVFAIAHIRGGGEMGRAWYEMGRLAQKPTTFSDFIRVARWMVDQGWTTPSTLVARGGSAGGLLMGAVMNGAPELFAGIVAEVPFVDVVTTMLDDTLPLTVGEWEEWGNPQADADAFRTMLGYSPYDNVRATNDDGTPRVYPALYATGGLNDSRVGYWEPAKWVQKIRDVNPRNKATLKMEMGAGHGGPSGRYDAWRDEAQTLAWIVNVAGA